MSGPPGDGRAASFVPGPRFCPYPLRSEKTPAHFGTISPSLSRVPRFPFCSYPLRSAACRRSLSAHIPFVQPRAAVPFLFISPSLSRVPPFPFCSYPPRSAACLRSLSAHIPFAQPRAVVPFLPVTPPLRRRHPLPLRSTGVPACRNSAPGWGKSPTPVQTRKPPRDRYGHLSPNATIRSTKGSQSNRGSARRAPAAQGKENRSCENFIAPGRTTS